MRTFLWLVAYGAALGIEIAVLPAWGVFSVIPLAHLVFLTVIAVERPAQAVWFAVAAGIIRDSIAPSSGASHTLVFMTLVAVIAGIIKLTDWDEPLRTIAAVVMGAMVTPLAALVSFGVTPVVSGRAVVGGPWYAFPVAPDFAAFASTGVWIGVLAVLMIRGFFRQRSGSFIG